VHPISSYSKHLDSVSRRESELKDSLSLLLLASSLLPPFFPLLSLHLSFPPPGGGAYETLTWTRSSKRLQRRGWMKELLLLLLLSAELTGDGGVLLGRKARLKLTHDVVEDLVPTARHAEREERAGGCGWDGDWVSWRWMELRERRRNASSKSKKVKLSEGGAQRPSSQQRKTFLNPQPTLYLYPTSPPPSSPVRSSRSSSNHVLGLPSSSPGPLPFLPSLPPPRNSTAEVLPPLARNMYL